MLYRGFSTQEELDAQYNLRESVPDFPGYEEFYTEQSRKTREQLECMLDIPFGPTLAERLDILPLKSCVRQSRAAVAWLYRSAESFGGDRTRIYVSGHSAGGHLTAMLALTKWEGDYGLPIDIINGGCTISGLFDLAPFPYTYLQPKLQLTWGKVLRNSPILHIPDEAPQLLVTYGDKETPELRRQSDDFLGAWKAKGLQGDYLPQPDKDHFAAIEGFLDADSPLCAAILRQIGVQS